MGRIVNIAILASGSGTNAENIVHYFEGKDNVIIKYILSNKVDAFVLERAKKLNIPTLTFNRSDFYDSDQILKFFQNNNIDWIILAGFLWLVPEYLINAYPNRIINIHPALLPKYGGKGMYGMRVHRAVVENSENESGITIHYVNNEYDKGNIIFQGKCKVISNDTAETVAEKVHKLEYEYYPKIIEEIIKNAHVS